MDTDRSMAIATHRYRPCGYRIHDASWGVLLAGEQLHENPEDILGNLDGAT